MKMRTLFVMTVFLILVWLTDGSEGVSARKKSDPRRAFFSKRSFPPRYKENSQYICAIDLCLPGMKRCTKTSYLQHSYQLQDELERKNLEIQCVFLFADCAAKCINIL
ncbi:hypothetical protein GDO81_001421 [Engystomops pustulosus]|uniref:Uncharacterized protein n=1 Tax=Engystomops pustulosus TaxID=76066 RepID=A0AAV7DDT7_ENGPU|nr:hypothetical protein GDO81_001421 [Engystomops pustulosus]